MTIDRLYISQGEDIDLELTYVQQNGSVLPLDSLGTKIYMVSSDGANNIIAKHKNGSAASGWKLIDSSLLANGTVKFNILSEVTKNLEPGDYYTELRARFPSLIHTDDGYFDVTEKRYVFSIVKSTSNTLTSLP